jgi:hypothetical protein
MYLPLPPSPFSVWQVDGQAGSITNIDIVRMWKNVCIGILIPRQELVCVLGMSEDFVRWERNVLSDMSKDGVYVRVFSLGFVPLGKSVLMLSISLEEVTNIVLTTRSRVKCQSGRLKFRNSRRSYIPGTASIL